MTSLSLNIITSLLISISNAQSGYWTELYGADSGRFDTLYQKNNSVYITQICVYESFYIHHLAVAWNDGPSVTAPLHLFNDCYSVNPGQCFTSFDIEWSLSYITSLQFTTSDGNTTSKWGGTTGGIYSANYISNPHECIAGIYYKDDGSFVDSLQFYYISTLTQSPSSDPTTEPTMEPTIYPTVNPSHIPTLSPSTASPTTSPTYNPSISPTNFPSSDPSHSPSFNPSYAPSKVPSSSPSNPTKLLYANGVRETTKIEPSTSLTPKFEPENATAEPVGIYLVAIIIVCIICIIIAVCMMILMLVRGKIEIRKKLWHEATPGIEMKSNHKRIILPLQRGQTGSDHREIVGELSITERHTIAEKYDLPINNLKMNVPSNSIIDIQKMTVPTGNGLMSIRNSNASVDVDLIDGNGQMVTSGFVKNGGSYSDSSDDDLIKMDTTMGDPEVFGEEEDDNTGGAGTTSDEATKEISSHPSNENGDGLGLELATSGNNMNDDALPMNVTTTKSGTM